MKELIARYIVELLWIPDTFKETKEEAIKATKDKLSKGGSNERQN